MAGVICAKPGIWVIQSPETGDRLPCLFFTEADAWLHLHRLLKRMAASVEATCRSGALAETETA